MSLLDDMGDRLEAQSVGTVATDIFLGRLPAAPNTAVALFEVIGPRPMRVMGRESVKRPHVQAITRALTYDEARAKMEEVYNAFVGFSGTINATRYLFIDAMSSIISLGPDEQKRHQFACTFDVKAGV